MLIPTVIFLDLCQKTKLVLLKTGFAKKISFFLTKDFEYYWTIFTFDSPKYLQNTFCSFYDEGNGRVFTPLLPTEYLMFENVVALYDLTCYSINA